MPSKQKRNDEQKEHAEAIEEDTEFGTVDAGSSKTYPQQCSALRKNGHVMIKGHPCKIVEMSTSKTGKHGHAKVHLTGLDIFTGKKYEDICPSTHNMDVPVVTRQDFQVIDVSREEDGYMSLMHDKTGESFGVRSPQGDLGKEIREKFEKGDQLNVTLVRALDEEAVQSVKVIAP